MKKDKVPATTPWAMKRQREDIAKMYRTIRFYYNPDCKFCVANEGSMYPPHDASDNCESGKRAHCSCDVCF